MHIIQSLSELPASFGPSAVTLGNFDGIHLGHRELFRRLVTTARQLGCASVVCTFDPHPLKFFASKNAPPLLNTRAEKRRLIAASQVDYLLEIPFDRDLAALSPEQFVDQTLIDRLGVATLVIGYDYAFGAGRQGNADFLEEYGRQKGFQVDVLHPVGEDGQPYSSTLIRNLLLEGDVTAILPLLGRHYNLEGQVVPGEQRGRRMGFPTANLETDKELLPAAGVYAVKVRHQQQDYDGVVNLGQRPTFTAARATIEVHLFDFNGDLYGQHLRIYFVERLRDEQKFSNADELARVIADDVQRARQILQATQVVQYQEYLSSE